MKSLEFGVPAGEGSGGEDSAEVPEFVFGIRGVFDRVRDGGPEQFVEAVAEPVEGDTHGDDGHFEGRRDLAVGGGGVVPPEVRFQSIEEFDPARGGEFVAKLAEHLFDQGVGPVAIKEGIGGVRFDGFVGVPCLGGLGVPGDDFLTAAALLGVAIAMLGAEEILQGSEEEGSKTAARWIRE